MDCTHLDWTELLDFTYDYCHFLKDVVVPASHLVAYPRRVRATSAQATVFDRYRAPAPVDGLVFSDGTAYYDVTQTALERLSGKLGIPPFYLLACPPELQAQNLNHWFSVAKGDWLLRHRFGTLRGFLSTQYSPFSHSRALNAVVQGLGDTQVTPRYAYVDDELLHVLLTLDDYAHPIGWTWDNSEDIHIPSLYIVNSEVGQRTVTVQLGIWRQVCSNGLMEFNEHEVKRRHQHLDPEQLEDDIRHMVQDAIRRAPTAIAHVKKAKATEVQQPLDLIRRIADHEKLTSRVRDAVTAAWYAEPVETHYGVVQAFTLAAQGLEPNTRVKLEQLAGRILHEPLAKWGRAS